MSKSKYFQPHPTIEGYYQHVPQEQLDEAFMSDIPPVSVETLFDRVVVNSGKEQVLTEDYWRERSHDVTWAGLVTFGTAERLAKEVISTIEGRVARARKGVKSVTIPRCEHGELRGVCKLVQEVWDWNSTTGKVTLVESDPKPTQLTVACMYNNLLYNISHVVETVFSKRYPNIKVKPIQFADLYEKLVAYARLLRDLDMGFICKWWGSHTDPAAQRDVILSQIAEFGQRIKTGKWSETACNHRASIVEAYEILAKYAAEYIAKSKQSA